MADGQNLPDTWNFETGENIKWQVKIPGLSHASPVIWGEKLFITSVISSQGDVSFKHGLYGDGTASNDSSLQKWMVYCFNKKAGKLLWKETAVAAKPIDKRHIKATYNNSSPATNGEIVVALFGSQGVYAYSADGEFLWKKDLGRLDVGAYDAPGYEWGSASSPIIYKDRVILQCDTQKESFVMACDIKSGKTIWRTDRDELPSWGTPTIFPGKDRVELITNSSNFIYGYNPDTGKEIYRQRIKHRGSGFSASPVAADGKIYLAGEDGQIYVVKCGAEYQLLATNEIGELLMATPAISDGMLYVRGQNHIFAVGK